MNDVLKQYPANPIIPVLHVENKNHAASMAEVAAEQGVGGVVVIDHNSDTNSQPHVVRQSAEKIRQEFPELWVGVNCLGFKAIESLMYFDELDVPGVWSDNALDWSPAKMYDLHWRYAVDAEGQVLRSVGQSKVHFGGVSMKGRGYIDVADDAIKLAAQTAPYVDILTTSGTGTGRPMDRRRLELIRKAIGQDAKLAVASGVDHFNLKWHLESADYVLVGTSIERRFGIIDPEKLKQLMSVFFEHEVAHLKPSAG